MPLYDDDNYLLSPYRFSGVGQTVAMTGSHKESAALTAKYVVVLSTAVACNIAWGSAPQATTSTTAIPAGVWVALNVGIGNTVSGLAASGSLLINELTT